MNRIEMKELLSKGELTPLEISIKKWEDIVFNNGEEKGAYNCALCELYFSDKNNEGVCIGCIIFEKTKQKLCERTPFRRLIKHKEKARCEGIKQISSCSICLSIAKEELKFLQGLK